MGHRFYQNRYVTRTTGTEVRERGEMWRILQCEGTAVPSSTRAAPDWVGRSARPGPSATQRLPIEVACRWPARLD
jgi:hypothetical protein